MGAQYVVNPRYFQKVKATADLNALYNYSRVCARLLFGEAHRLSYLYVLSECTHCQYTGSDTYLHSIVGVYLLRRLSFDTHVCN